VPAVADSIVHSMTLRKFSRWLRHMLAGFACTVPWHILHIVQQLDPGLPDTLETALLVSGQLEH